MDRFRLSPGHCVVVVVDIQEKLTAVMPKEQAERCIRSTKVVLETARRLSIPVLVTEQYPKGLGPTVAGVREALEQNDSSEAPYARPQEKIEKVEFDVCDSEGFRQALERTGRKQVILCGQEAHICVWQSTRSLLAQGYPVHVVQDATCSRDPEHKRLAEELWRQAGAVVTTAETVAFDLLRVGRGEDFKAISRLIR